MAIITSILDCEAAELMNGEIIRLPANESIRNAALLLVRNGSSAAPVVDDEGRCVGVWSATEFLKLASSCSESLHPAAPPLPLTCSYQKTAYDPDGAKHTLCALPDGACPIQGHETGPAGEPRLTCREPHCVLCEWQVVELEKLPIDAVSRYMRPAISIERTTPLREVAHKMAETHAEQLVVLDEERLPVGMIEAAAVVRALAEHLEA